MMPGEFTVEPKGTAPTAPITCLGCENCIPWDGKGMFCYTCPCGATVFHRGDFLIPPASLVFFLEAARNNTLPREPAHYEYWLGRSAKVTALKRAVLADLKTLGVTSALDCEKCRDREAELRKEYGEEVG